MECGDALLAAVRRTGRGEVVVPALLSPARLEAIRGCCGAAVRVMTVGHSAGRIDLADLKDKTSDATAAVYLETPNYVGVVETDVAEIIDTAHRLHAEAVVGVDPLSVGVLGSPVRYGADVVIVGGEGAGREVGEMLLRHSAFVAARIGEIPGVRIRWGGFFRQFVVDFNDSGVRVVEVNRFLGERGVVGGRDLSGEFPELGQAACFEVIESQTIEDLVVLAEALAEAVAAGRT